MFKKIPLNEIGRDFIVGDIHGAYDSVIQGMKDVKFNRKVDRLFSVGDLIDRGPDSHRALDFLAQPYVYAIRGNHDHDFTTANIDELRVLGGVNWNGMDWINKASDDLLQAMQAAFQALPIAMEVQTSRGTVGLVHGDVPAGMNWSEFVQKIQSNDESIIDIALTGRNRLQSNDTNGVEGIGRLFVGHTIQWRGPKKLGNVYAIDSGAVFRELGHNEGSLSVVNMICHTSVLTNQSQTHAQVAVYDAPAALRFGKYTSKSGQQSSAKPTP